MLPETKKYSVSSEVISNLLKTHYSSLMQAFYESQSFFLSGIYKRYGSIETANIILCFAKSTHLEIIRQREKDLNFDVSLEKFWKNFSSITIPSEKITEVVKATGIPKETVRRKIKNLQDSGFLIKDKKNKGYYWNLSQKEKKAYFDIIHTETKNLSSFIVKIILALNVFPNKESYDLVNKEIESQFSFYWYHYLSCQLDWLRYWQLKLKDNDLLLITLQTMIPTLRYIDKNPKEIKLDNVFKIIGSIKKNYFENCSVSATSVSDVTGIPRATCIRKLDKLVALGLLTRNCISKRYFINQSVEERTKNIISSENVSFTIKNFSNYIAII
mgnify:CR=1 FL=1